VSSGTAIRFSGSFAHWSIIQAGFRRRLHLALTSPTRFLFVKTPPPPIRERQRDHIGSQTRALRILRSWKRAGEWSINSCVNIQFSPRLVFSRHSGVECRIWNGCWIYVPARLNSKWYLLAIGLVLLLDQPTDWKVSISSERTFLDR
jgi:hypothetical protein